jgi:hypothetical protein
MKEVDEGRKLRTQGRKDVKEERKEVKEGRQFKEEGCGSVSRNGGGERREVWKGTEGKQERNVGKEGR